MLFMADETKSIKIGKVEIKDHRNVSFTTAFILVLIAFTAGALAYRYLFMIIPQKPECVQIMVKTIGGEPIPNAGVKVYLAILINETGEQVAGGVTDSNGRVKFCGMFLPNENYLTIINDEYGNEIWVQMFATNEKATADFPIIVKQEYT